MNDDAKRLVQALEALTSLTDVEAQASSMVTGQVHSRTEAEQLRARFTANIERIREDTNRARQREEVLLDISDCLMRLFAHGQARPTCEQVASLMRGWRLLQHPFLHDSGTFKTLQAELENERDFDSARIIAKLRDERRATFEDLKAASDGLTSKQLALLAEALATARTLVE